jgi:hypothetical protein
LGAARSGAIVDRIRALAEHVLSSAEQRCGITATPGTTIPERVKGVRRAVLEKQEALEERSPQRAELRNVLADAFFVVQLFSYPGNYLTAESSVERFAETLDKLEEDVLGKYSATIRSRRAVTVAIGEPLKAASEKGNKNAVGELTEALEQRVQQLLDELNGSAGRSA